MSEQLNHDSTAEEIIDYYDSHLTEPTLKEIAQATGRSVVYLKGLLMHPGKVETKQEPKASPTCQHGKGFKCRQCWPIQYWRTNP